MTSQYAKTVAKLNEQAEKDRPQHRTNYRCAANGCPNAGCIDDDYGKPGSGRCYWHWREDDPTKWDAITSTIRAKQMLNWDPREILA